MLSGRISLSTWAPFVVVMAAGSSAAVPAGGASLAKLFPEFARQNANLGSVALLADVAVVEDVIGKTEKVYLDDCRKVGERMLDVFASGMGEKGYTMQRKPLASVGEVVDRDLDYRILSTWEQHKMESEGFLVMKPPFYTDSTLCHDDESRAAWAGVCSAVTDFEKKRTSRL